MASVVNQVPHDFAVLSGDDSITIPLIALGGHGVISVASNEIPKQMTELTQYALANNFAAAREVQRKYLALMEINFVEANPIPMKLMPADAASDGSHAVMEASSNHGRCSGRPAAHLSRQLCGQVTSVWSANGKLAQRASGDMRHSRC